MAAGILAKDTRFEKIRGRLQILRFLCDERKRKTKQKRDEAGYLSYHSLLVPQRIGRESNRPGEWEGNRAKMDGLRVTAYDCEKDCEKKQRPSPPQLLDTNEWQEEQLIAANWSIYGPL